MPPSRVDKNPRVSAISIFHNAEDFLADAVESVLRQSFGDFELLLVDDGSTDSSTAIAKAYAERDPRIRYLEHSGHSNRGMSATRNLGVSTARGEFVAFIDADDRWRTSKLAEQVELLDRLPEVDAVGGAVNYWKSHSGGEDRIVPTGHVRDRPISPGEATLALYPLGKADAPSMSDLMFRRAAILKVGGSEEAFTGAYEDQAFLAKFYLNSTLYFTDSLWSDYRLHPASCMAELSRTGRYDDARRNFLDWFERYLDGSPSGNDVRIRSALANARARSRTNAERLRDFARTVPGAVPLVRAARKAADRLRPLLAPGPAILMYHRIAEEQFDPWGLAVSPANFADHLEWISRNRTPLPLPLFVELNRRGKLPRNAVAVTFDDGYACGAELAAPLLERTGVPATIFIAPQLIERGQEFWWDELERIVLAHQGNSLRLDGREIVVGESRDEDRSWKPATEPRTARQRAYRELWTLLYGRPSGEVESAITQLRAQARVAERPRQSHRPLRAGEIRTIASDIVAFGSHTLSHPSLPRLPRKTNRNARSKRAWSNAPRSLA
jgi:glycosyltransferase involved in cell wall biosynthesis/peptidoglycan/xylan/chitin deacetylase (PgdA/CDA1 family)